MRRKIKQKIGFLHPERGVNEPVRRTRQATSAEHPEAEDGVQGALTDAEGPGIVRFRVPDVREKPETHVNGGKSFRMVRDTAFPTPTDIMRRRKGHFQRRNISKG